MHSILKKMEKMANNVVECLTQASIDHQFLQCFKGIGSGGIFNDEECLKEFLQFSEEHKEECNWTYGTENAKSAHFQAPVDLGNLGNCCQMPPLSSMHHLFDHCCQ